MMRGLHKVPDEISRMTPAQLVAIAHAAKDDGDKVRIHSTDDYAYWERRWRQQQDPEHVLTTARKALEEERKHGV